MPALAAKKVDAAVRPGIRLVEDGELVDPVGNIGADEDMPSWGREWRR
jgi:hypothetical protein